MGGTCPICCQTCTPAGVSGVMTSWPLWVTASRFLIVHKQKTAWGELLRKTFGIWIVPCWARSFKIFFGISREFGRGRLYTVYRTIATNCLPEISRSAMLARLLCTLKLVCDSTLTPVGSPRLQIGYQRTDQFTKLIVSETSSNKFCQNIISRRT